MSPLIKSDDQYVRLPKTLLEEMVALVEDLSKDPICPESYNDSLKMLSHQMGYYLKK